MEQCQGIN